MRRRAALGSIALLLALLVAQPAHAQTDAPREPVVVRYHLDTSNLTLLSWWYGVKARQAFDWWEEREERLPAPVRFERVDDPTSADVRFWFRDASRVGEVCGHSETALGCANTTDGGRTWSIEVRMRDLDGRLYAYHLIGDVAKHEVGHALGLPHSENPNDIMFFALDTSSYAGARPITSVWVEAARVLGLILLMLALVVVLIRIITKRPSEEDDALNEGDEAPRELPPPVPPPRPPE